MTRCLIALTPILSDNGMDAIEIDDKRVDAAVSSEPQEDEGHHQAPGCLKENLLLILTLAGVVIGLGLGIGLYFAKLDDIWLLWIGFPGELILRAFKLLILPLVVSCVINITASSSIGANGKMGGLAMLYIITTNFVGAILGLIFVVIIQPGSSTQSDSGGGGAAPTTKLTTSDILTDLFRNLIPDNIITMAFETSQTMYSSVNRNGTTVMERQNGTSRGMNILGALFVSILFGLATSVMGQQGEAFRSFFETVTRATTLLLSKIVWCLPLGLMSLIAKSLAEVNDMEKTFISLGAFIGTVAAALVLNQFVIHLALFLAFVRKNPFPFYWKMMKAYLVAFSANSSVSALPVMLECADNAGLRTRISRFILPLCCNTNSDGSCAYIAASVTFLAQLTGMELSFGNYILIIFLAGVSGLSLPSVPSSSIIVIIGILSNLGIPDTNVSLLYTGEFILDRLRTGCNTWSHCTCAAAMDARIPHSEAELKAAADASSAHATPTAAATKSDAGASSRPQAGSVDSNAPLVKDDQMTGYSNSQETSGGERWITTVEV